MLVWPWCHKKYSPGEISSPGGSGLRVFSPPGGYTHSCFQDGSSTPRTNAPGMHYHYPNYVPAIQQQGGGNDCGIFANAFALHSLLGETLETVEFDQSKMRGHLLECLKKEELVRFSTKPKLGFRSHHFPYREVELFCKCLMPDTWKDTMIEYEGCNGWYHTECVGFMSLPQSTEQWTCSLCTV